MSPQEALDQMYQALRQVQANAETHDQLKRMYETVKGALKSSES